METSYLLSHEIQSSINLPERKHKPPLCLLIGGFFFSFSPLLLLGRRGVMIVSVCSEITIKPICLWRLRQRQLTPGNGLMICRPGGCSHWAGGNRTGTCKKQKRYKKTKKQNHRIQWKFPDFFRIYYVESLLCPICSASHCCDHHRLTLAACFPGALWFFISVILADRLLNLLKIQAIFHCWTLLFKWNISMAMPHRGILVQHLSRLRSASSLFPSCNKM